MDRRLLGWMCLIVALCFGFLLVHSSASGSEAKVHVTKVTAVNSKTGETIGVYVGRWELVEGFGGKYYLKWRPRREENEKPAVNKQPADNLRSHIDKATVKAKVDTHAFWPFRRRRCCMNSDRSPAIAVATFEASASQG